MFDCTEDEKCQAFTLIEAVRDFAFQTAGESCRARIPDELNKQEKKALE